MVFRSFFWVIWIEKKQFFVYFSTRLGREMGESPKSRKVEAHLPFSSLPFDSPSTTSCLIRRLRELELVSPRTPLALYSVAHQRSVLHPSFSNSTIHPLTRRPSLVPALLRLPPPYVETQPLHRIRLLPLQITTAAPDPTPSTDLPATLLPPPHPFKNPTPPSSTTSFASPILLPLLLPLLPSNDHSKELDSQNKLIPERVTTAWDSESLRVLFEGKEGGRRR